MPDPITNIVADPDPISRFVPQAWQEFLALLSTPIAWVLSLGQAMVEFFLQTSGWMAGMVSPGSR